MKLLIMRLEKFTEDDPSFIFLAVILLLAVGFVGAVLVDALIKRRNRERSRRAMLHRSRPQPLPPRT